MKDIILTFYYFFNVAIWFVIYWFWKWLLFLFFPIAPFVYVVDKFLK
jgi:hypothetical protein